MPVMESAVVKRKRDYKRRMRVIRVRTRREIYLLGHLGHPRISPSINERSKNENKRKVLSDFLSALGSRSNVFQRNE